MSAYVIDAAERPSVEVDQSSARFPVRRVFCVGRNYADHAREMGADPDREPPFFFTKPADAIVPASGTVAYPPLTNDLHHEIELVVAIGGTAGRSTRPTHCRTCGAMASASTSRAATCRPKRRS